MFRRGQSFQLALNAEPRFPLAAIALYCSMVAVTDWEELSKISRPVPGLCRDQDHSIPVDHVRWFEESLDAAQFQTRFMQW